MTKVFVHDLLEFVRVSLAVARRPVMACRLIAVNSVTHSSLKA